MDLSIQALVMGLTQGLTEFLPISSSGHLILVPYLLGWTDPFIKSLAFSVMLHMGTLVALLAYFWRDWARLVPAGLSALAGRSLAGDPDRRSCGWLIGSAGRPTGSTGSGSRARSGSGAPRRSPSSPGSADRGSASAPGSGWG